MAKLRRDQKFPPVMGTTAFTSPDEPLFDSTMEAMAAAGFTHLRMGYYRFEPRSDPAECLERVSDTVQRLSAALAAPGFGIMRLKWPRFVERVSDRV